MSDVLVVDDEESICWGLRRLLTEEGHRVRVASSAEDALVAIAEIVPDLVVLDVRLPGMDGLAAMSKIRGLAQAAPIVVITAFGNLSTAVAAIQNGAFDYLPKPFDLDQAAAVIARALAYAKPDADRQRATDARARDGDELLGASNAMQEVFKRIAMVARTEVPVLITGESGTGKELVARAIHQNSAGRSGPLVAVNLAALSPTLVESELFGHARGAFTGAAGARQGVLELAQGGTVFLDEAADIPLNIQVKLLRALEQREVTPVGESRSRPTAFRIVAATNRDLRQECAAGRFRQDLYFRLAVFEIQLPPLRERPTDISLLANRFLALFNEATGTSPELLDSTIEELQARPWPGNVRELRNAVEHAALMARGGPIAPEHLPAPDRWPGECAPDAAGALRQAVRGWATSKLGAVDGASQLYQHFLSEVEPALFETVLGATRQNRALAADMLGMHRATLRKKLLESE